MPATNRFPLLAASLAALVACATPNPPASASRAEPPAKGAEPAPDAASVAAMTDPRGCALVLGGGGAVFDGKEANDFFRKINTAVTDDVFQFLTMNGFRVEKMFLDAQESSGEGRGVQALVNMRRLRCSKLVQVSHFMDGPKTARQFGFVVTVMAAAPGDRTQGGRMFTLKGLHEKRYAYPLTKETISTLHASDIANQIGADLADTALLTKRGAAQP
jgi:hypothetical protein